MKRLAVFILSILIAASSFVTAFAESSLLYKDKFVNYMKKNYPDETNYNYDELYCHKTDSGDVDWALVYAATGDNDSGGGSNGIFGDVFFWHTGTSAPFEAFRLGVYDVDKDDFYDLQYAWNMDFKDLKDVFYELMTTRNIEKEYHLGYYIIGDVDSDKRLSVKDATLLQRFFAEIENPWNYVTGYSFDYQTVPLFGPLVYSDRPSFEYYTDEPDSHYTVVCVWDYNSDNKLNIKDVTAIQKKIAKLNFAE